MKIKEGSRCIVKTSRKRCDIITILGGRCFVRFLDIKNVKGTNVESWLSINVLEYDISHHREKIISQILDI